MKLLIWTAVGLFVIPALELRLRAYMKKGNT